MDQFDFVSDNGVVALRILERNPVELSMPLERIRVHVNCSDCVAGLDVDAESWSGFIDMFQHDYVGMSSKAWISPAGEWKLMIERSESDIFVFSSELDSLHDYNRWRLHTTFQMSRSQFWGTAKAFRDFIGVWK